MVSDATAGRQSPPGFPCFTLFLVLRRVSRRATGFPEELPGFLWSCWLSGRAFRSGVPDGMNFQRILFRARHRLMGHSIRYAGPCPNCSLAMFVTLAPPLPSEEKKAVVCHGCGARWRLDSTAPLTAANAPTTIQANSANSFLDQKVDLLLEAADAQLSSENPVA